MSSVGAGRRRACSDWRKTGYLEPDAGSDSSPATIHPAWSLPWFPTGQSRSISRGRSRRPGRNRGRPWGG